MAWLFIIPFCIGVCLFSVYKRWAAIAEVEVKIPKVIALYVVGAILLASSIALFGKPVSWGLSIVYGVGSGLFLAAAIVDLETMYLPDELTYPLIAFAGVAGVIDVGFTHTLHEWIELLVPGLFGYLIFVAIDRIHLKTTGSHGLGGGDAKLFAGIAILVGAIPSLVVLVGASLISVLHHLCLRKFGKGDSYLPFGPPLIVSTLIVWISILSIGIFEFHEVLYLPVL